MEIVSMDSLIIKIMSYAQKLVNADRASLFLVDPKSNQLYARLFDVTDHNENPAASALQDINKEVRWETRAAQWIDNEILLRKDGNISVKFLIIDIDINSILFW